MCVSTLLANSAVRSWGRARFSVSLIWIQSVRLIVPGNSQPRSYFPAMNAGKLDAVDVGQTGHEVVRVPKKREARVGAVALEHPGARADDGLGLLEIAELLDTLAGDDGHCHGVGQRIEEPREWLFQGELHRVAIHRLHPAYRPQHVGARVALQGQEALDRVPNVLCGELTAIDGWLG